MYIGNEIKMKMDSNSDTSKEVNIEEKVWNMISIDLGGPTKNIVWFSNNQKFVCSVLFDGKYCIAMVNCKENEKKYIEAHSQEILSIALSTDDKVIASASRDDTIKLWDQEGKEIKCLEAKKGYVFCVTFQNKGSLLASTFNDGCAILWDIKTGEKVYEFETIAKTPHYIAFSSNGQTIALNRQIGIIQLWNIENPTSPTLQRNLRVNDVHVNCIQFSYQKNMIALGLQNNKIKIWNLDNEKTKVGVFSHDHKGAITSLAFSHDDEMLLSASTDQTVKLSSFKDNNLKLLVDFISSSTGDVYSVAFSKKDIVLAWSEDSTVKLWRPKPAF